MSFDEDFHEVALINAIEEISTDSLRKVSHRKCIDQLVRISDQALRYDSTRLLLLLDAIKSCNQACYKRDLLFDVLNELFSSDDVLIGSILSHPFPDKNQQSAWKDLANAIATIPDLSANCQAQSRIPLFTQDLFHRRLLDAIYASLDSVPKPIDENIRLFLLQLLGRISFSNDGTLLWRHFTLKVINEKREEVKSIASDILGLPLLSDHKYEPFEIFMDRFYQPMFFYLTPSNNSGDKLYSMLRDGVKTNEHLRYMICDKSIFKANHSLDRQRQGQLLFNIAAYLSKLANTIERRRKDGQDHVCNRTNKTSLLMQTLIEILKQWSSATKSLFRTYEQSRHITTAAIVLFRYALQYDKKSLAEHANDIETLIATAMPTYLNRASREDRDLAMCLAELLLPKLLELNSVRPNGARNEKASDLIISWKFDYTDDLLYLQRLFKQDVEVIFQDVPDDTKSCSVIELGASCQPTERPNKNQSSSSTTQSDSLKCEIREKRASIVPDVPVTDPSSRMEPFVELLNDKTTTNIQFIEDDDLKPYAMCADENDGSDDDQDDDAEYDPEATSDNVPIYLRDCIEGLVENSSYRYVRLCLMKAGELIEQLMLDDVGARDRQMLSADKRLNHTTASGSSTSDAAQLIDAKSKGDQINATIKDVGIELARALLFLDNQFNIKGFKDYRMRALRSLCVAAPQLIGKYLIDQFNGSNRSMQQQLDILQILMESAERLATTAPAPAIDLERSEEVGAIAPREPTRQPQQRINRFSAHAALYFYGIVYKLKADFMESKSLVITQPKSILSAFRELKCHTIEEEEEKEKNCHQQSAASMQLRPELPGSRTTNRAVKQLESTIISLKGDIDRDDSANVDSFLERNSLSDDSYLLSRIILATSIVLRCARQQLVLCKLSGDLLDILAAYRCHPDAGVQKSMIASLKAIRNCTPSVYLENFLEKRMVELFGPWLARIEMN